MDNFKIIYKILKVFEKNLDVEGPDWEDLTPQKLNISEVLWQNLIQMLIKAGYIDGIKITSTATGTYITPINPQITLQGLQYLEENSMMRKAYRLAKGIKDITPGINIVNQARVTACFFIAQERAQYRAEAHDMEVSEMEMKQVYEALEKVENGADLIAAIKGEINTLNNEAKKHRTAGEQSATKLKSILEE
ncbi:YjcQ family protein [Phascolarctobacterium succinatutens]|uniref:YjcQ family protein n=1 Tax=Phascolarctobacterium succinatutens TaxID=626940 RepID=UPI003AB88C92